jgi:hypothetical protein
LNDGTERKFINDNDTVIIKGFLQKMDKWESVWKFLQNYTPLYENNCSKIINIKSPVLNIWDFFISIISFRNSFYIYFFIFLLQLLVDRIAAKNI